MKLLLAASLAAALAVGLFLVPISGRTLWQRAEARGLPQSAARAMSNGAHAAVRWAEEKRAHAGNAQGPALRKLPHKEVAHAGSSDAHAGNPDSRASNSEAHGDGTARVDSSPRTQFGEAHVRNLPAAPGAGARDSDATDERAIPLQPPLAHDHIVAAPAKEHLSEGDRQGLDKLIAGSRAQR